MGMKKKLGFAGFHQFSIFKKKNILGIDPWINKIN